MITCRQNWPIRNPRNVLFFGAQESSKKAQTTQNNTNGPESNFNRQLLGKAGSRRHQDSVPQTSSTDATSPGLAPLQLLERLEL